MRFFVLAVLLSTAVSLWPRPADADTWTNAGKKSIQLESGNYSSPDRYVAATAVVVFKAGEFIENDTRTPVEGPKVEENDPEREGRIIRTGGTLAADKWIMIPETGLFGIGESVIVVFDGKAPEGATLTLALDVHDKRLGTDPRHDDWANMKTWTFTISNACPSGLMTDSIAQTTPARNRSHPVEK